jgi:hypothetical protein
MTPSKLRLAQAAMKHRDTSVSKLCDELGVSRTTLYRCITPQGELTEVGKRALLDKRKRKNGGA